MSNMPDTLDVSINDLPEYAEIANRGIAWIRETVLNHRASIDGLLYICVDCWESGGIVWVRMHRDS